MTASILNQPKSSALLQPTKWQLQFVRIPDIVYFCHEWNLPGGEVKPVTQVTPFKNRLVAGSKLEYDFLDITFSVEEEMYSWESIHNWLKDIGTETSFDDYNNLKRFPNPSFVETDLSYPNAYCDATITVLDTSNIPKIRYTFHDCFPTKLGNIKFSTEMSALDVIKCDAKFGFFYYDIERVPG